jgi:hypothetical protein
MATTTPLNAWPVPTSTDYVKDGATAIEALGDAIDTSVGSGLLAWQTWAPTLSAGWLNGNGVYGNNRYVQIGKTVHFQFSFTIGSTTTKSGTFTYSLPVAAANTNLGNARFTCAAFGGSTYAANASIAVTAGTIFYWGSAGAIATWAQLTATAPATFATGDNIQVHGTYQAA